MYRPFVALNGGEVGLQQEGPLFSRSASLGPTDCVCVSGSSSWLLRLTQGGEGRRWQSGLSYSPSLSLPLYLNIAAPACVFPLSKRDCLFYSCCTLFSVIIPSVGHRLVETSTKGISLLQSSTSHNLLLSPSSHLHLKLSWRFPVFLRILQFLLLSHH